MTPISDGLGQSNDVLALICPLDAPATNVFGQPTVCGQYNASQFPPPPTIAPPPPPSTESLQSTNPMDAINSVISSGVRQSQQIEQGFFNNLTPADNPTGTLAGLGFLGIATIGLVIAGFVLADKI